MRLFLILTAALCSLPSVTRAQTPLSIGFRPVSARVPFIGKPAAPPGAQCRAAIQDAERTGALPLRLMSAIGQVESGRKDPQTGIWTPWPWTINAEGQGYFFDSKQEAIGAVLSLQAKGVRSIDVGCMQINLMHHPDAFASLDQAFDPVANARYAARFLNQLYDQTKDWPRATGLYHSATPDLAADYQRRVQAALTGQKGGALESFASKPIAGLSPGEPAARFAVTLPAGRLENIRIIPLNPFAGASAQPQGRSLDSYRTSPIVISSQSFRIGG